MKCSSNGAVVTFSGVVRSDEKEGKKVTHIEYSFYKTMAEKAVNHILLEAEQKYDVSKIYICHSTGVVKIGEISMFVALSVPHRKEAFEILRYVVEKIKIEVPIWKKEVFSDNTYKWV